MTLERWDRMEKFKVIPGYDSWVSIEKLTKGWSVDTKYIVKDEDGNKFLLRITSSELYEKKAKQFKLLQEVEKLGINASKPICFGRLNDDEVYTVLTWLEGEDAETAVAKLGDKEAYLLGIEAGKILQKLHALPVSLDDVPSWWEKYTTKMVRKYKAMDDCPVEVPNKELLKKYMDEHMYLVKDRKQTFTHADYHVGNLIVCDGKIGVIDFDKNTVADPYDEFKPFVWNVSVSEYFETGLINGYFDNKVPSDFFPILALYAVEHLISFIPWALKFGDEETQKGYEIHNKIMKWYDNMNLVVPTWYKGVL
ncbi:MAG: phosphotransferase family protein [Erysipelotrichaceae bacterium]|nr:phosphotransferase family protein [Erysipelotrichaceae bacterium]